MNMQWNPSLLNSLVAPNIAEFTTANIADLRPEFPEAEHWISNHFLNNVIRGKYEEPTRYYAVNVLYRTQTSFRAYHHARDKTIDFLRDAIPHNPKVGVYFEALSWWESMLFHWAIAHDLYCKMAGRPFFDKNDGSIDQRAFDMTNTLKHFAGAIKSSNANPGSCIPMWLSNLGLNTLHHSVTFEELAELLRDSSKAADKLQDPRKLTEFNQQLPPSSDGDAGRQR